MGLDFLIVLNLHWLKLLRLWPAAPGCSGECPQGRKECNCRKVGS